MLFRHLAISARTRKRGILAILLSTVMLTVIICKLSLSTGSPQLQTRQVINVTYKNDNDRAEYVRRMTMHAWQTYAHLALGKNEFRPISNVSVQPNMFGHGHSLGAFLVDSLDTLLIMGFHGEARRAMQWLKENFDASKVNGFVNTFEVNIRILGGFLGAFAVSKNENDKAALLSYAKQIADRLLPAFDENNLAHSLVNLQSGQRDMHHWAPHCIVLSEAGSIQLEMDYLSKISGDEKYSQKARLGTQALLARYNGNDYIPLYEKGFCRKHVSMGALGDSFYEYLLKVDVLSPTGAVPGHKRFEAFLKSIKVVESQILKENGRNNTFFGEYYDSFQPTMSHLACFSSGMYALAKIVGASANADELSRFERLARDIAFTCRKSYLAGNGLGPEVFRVSGNGMIERTVHRYYILRPEYVESLFYMYRLTNEEIYRDWAWDVVLAIERRCKVPGGYSGIKDVFSPISVHDDLQQTFFIAETLKYLYLIFGESNFLPLDKFVFSTEGHPFRIS